MLDTVGFVWILLDLALVLEKCLKGVCYQTNRNGNSVGCCCWMFTLHWIVLDLDGLCWILMDCVESLWIVLGLVGFRVGSCWIWHAWVLEECLNGVCCVEYLCRCSQWLAMSMVILS